MISEAFEKFLDAKTRFCFDSEQNVFYRMGVPYYLCICLATPKTGDVPESCTELDGSALTKNEILAQDFSRHGHSTTG